MEGERMKDIYDGTAHVKRMTYKELVEDMNADLKALEQIERPLALFKEGEAEVGETMKKQDESLKKVKRIVYPAWALIILVNSLLMIAYYKQDTLILKNQEKIDNYDRFQNYKYS